MSRPAIQCPGCGGRLCDVIWTRPKNFTFNGVTYCKIRRSRRCVHCGTTWITSEELETDQVDPGHVTPPDPDLPPESPDVMSNPFL